MKDSKEKEPEKINLEKIPPFLLKVKFNPHLTVDDVKDELKEDVEKIKQAIKEPPNENK